MSSDRKWNAPASRCLLRVAKRKKRAYYADVMSDSSNSWFSSHETDSPTCSPLFVASTAHASVRVSEGTVHGWSSRIARLSLYPLVSISFSFSRRPPAYSPRSSKSPRMHRTKTGIARGWLRWRYLLNLSFKRNAFAVLIHSPQF